MTTVTIPLTLPSVANLREHWSTKARRVTAHRNALRLALPTRSLTKERNWLEINGRLVVTLVRISPRKLDDDNLAYAFKATRDQIAEQLGIDDADPCIGWHYEQEKPPAQVAPRTSTGRERHAIRITLACVANEHPQEVPF